MKKEFGILFMIVAMMSLIIEKSSCYQILVVGLLMLIAIAIDKNNSPKV